MIDYSTDDMTQDKKQSHTLFEFFEYKKSMQKTKTFKSSYTSK